MKKLLLLLPLVLIACGESKEIKEAREKRIADSIAKYEWSRQFETNAKRGMDSVQAINDSLLESAGK